MVRRLSFVVAALVLGAHIAEAQGPTCTTQKPADGWVCIGGGWLPPGHPDIPTTPRVDVPPPHQPPPATPFKIGRRYWRNASGVNPTDIYIAGAGQLADGTSVLFAVCRVTGDGCYSAGEVRLFLANASAAGWDDRTNAPY